MPPSSATRQRADAAAALAAARRRHVLPLEQLQRLSARLDELMRDVSFGTTSHRQHERNVEEAEAIAAGIRGAFRCPAGTPVPHRNDGCY